MRKVIYFIPLVLFAIFMSGCGEYNRVLKSKDVDYKFDFAKRAYNNKQYVQASTVLADIITPLKGSSKGEEALYLLAMSYYENKDYLNSGAYFKTYYTRYPKGQYTENARFYSGYGYYLDSPESQLDQSGTLKAIQELQAFLDYFPKSDRATTAQKCIFDLQDKLTLKELENAQLYYNLGTYLGNNYESAIIVAENTLKDYPYTKYREDLEMIILRSKYQEALNSIAIRQADRYREVVDEYYSFINNFPDSNYRKEADNILKNANKHLGNQLQDND